MHFADEILVAVKAKLDAAWPAAPAGPVRRYFKGQERSEGEGGDAGLITISLGEIETADVEVSLYEEMQQVTVDLGYSRPIPDSDITGYGPLLELDETAVAAICDDTVLDGIAQEVFAGTLEAADDANADIGAVVRHIVVRVTTRRTSPGTRL